MAFWRRQAGPKSSEHPLRKFRTYARMQFEKCFPMATLTSSRFRMDKPNGLLAISG